MDMNAQATEPHTHISRLNSSKASLEKLDAVVRDSAGPSTPNRKQRTNLRQLVEDKAELAANPIQQPKPLTQKRPYSSFLTDAVDQPSSPRPKRYRPESVNKLVTQWVESVSGSEAYRETHCRSDSLLNHSDGGLISKRRPQSVPNMVNNRDTEGSTKPATPDSAISRSNQSIRPSDAVTNAVVTSAASTNKSNKSPVEDPSYRNVNLRRNHIFLRLNQEEFPEHIKGLIDLVRRGRNSPEPSLDPEQELDLEMLSRGAPENDVQSYFQQWIFPRSRNVLHCSDRMLMVQHAVPKTCVKHKLSIPKPDLLYGYDRDLTFPQHCLLGSLSKDVTATTSLLAYPFLDVEFKGDGPSGSGSMWVAINQCLGGAASCVNLAERLNDRLKGCKNDEIRSFNSAAFSVASNAREARLFICWKDDDLNYYLQEFEGFLLSIADHHLRFRRYVRNIIDWGKDQRLQEIRNSLDILLEENRKRASPDEYGASDTLRDDDSNNSDPEEVCWGKEGQEERGMQSATAASRKGKRRTSEDGSENDRDAAKKRSKSKHASKAKVTKAKSQAKARRIRAAKAANPHFHFLRSSAARAKAKRAVSKSRPSPSDDDSERNSNPKKGGGRGEQGLERETGIVV
ncbi:hypothetical protein MMC07_002894 [Pseudocyphellaria aurata]|nr:hypothetical protein [Pseudocyphellaria aurata]